jgi:very-short-patch-repair endonuclease
VIHTRIGIARAGKKSELEEHLAMHIRVNRLPQPEREHRFHPDRRWRFDFAYPKWKIAAECEGGVWTQGRHTRGSGFIADLEKYNAAALEGWLVLRFTRTLIASGEAVLALKRAIELREEVPA